MNASVHFYPEDDTIGRGPANNFTFPNGTAFAEFVTSKAYEKAPHEKIGQGGYSTVYRLHFDTQDFVLKVAEESMHELLKEINTLIKVKNKWFAVQLIAASVYPEGKAFILYPYVEGKTFSLFQRYTKKDEAGIRLYRSIYNDLIDAIYELHQMGIIHHDIKPQNIWIPDVGRPFLLDFGLSEMYGTEKQMIGTPAYTNFKRWKNRARTIQKGELFQTIFEGTKPVTSNINWFALGRTIETFNPNNNSKNGTLRKLGISNAEAHRIRFGGGKRRLNKTRKFRHLN